MALTSIDIANCIRIACKNKYRHELTNLQVNKMVYFIYGLYYKNTNNLLFTDDTPKAWPFGPVFPRIFKRYSRPFTFTKETSEEIKNDSILKNILLHVLDEYHSMSSVELSEMTHGIETPWRITMDNSTDENGKPKYNVPIEIETIKDHLEVEYNVELDK